MRVIVVDDNDTIRVMVRVILEQAGYDVVEVPGGAEAVQAVRDHGADLVICDLFMPDMDGIELIRDLRREFPDMKVLAMSGGGVRGTVDMLTAARILGAAETLEKPFTARRLLEVVEDTLRPPSGAG